MAIIDPDGLFNGDRLRKCSKMARLYWPYFFLASNGYGRLEVNYHRIVARAFSSFDKDDVPTEPELLGYLKEYAHVHLLFLYMNGGQMWGQWDAKENCLSKYKTSADKKSPAPPEEEFAKWKASYKTETKSFASSLESFAKSSDKVSEVFLQISPLGVGVGIGNGDGEKQNPPRAKAARVDERFTPVKDFIEKCCKHANVPFVWQGAEAKQLSEWLKATPGMDVEGVKLLVRNRFSSKDPPGKRPCKWLPDLGKYATGPLDRFDKEADEQRKPNRNEERQQEGLSNIAKALRNRLGEADGSYPGAISEYAANGNSGDGVAGRLGAASAGVRDDSVSTGGRADLDSWGDILPPTRGHPQGD